MSGACPPEPAPAEGPLVTIDLSRPLPPYEQIRVAITDLVAAGRLPAGSRLPSVRQLAGDLGVAPGTVAHAYRALDAAGVVVGLGRYGTVVRATTPPSDLGGTSAIDVAGRRLVAIARSLGLSVSDTEAIVRAAWLSVSGTDGLGGG